MVWCDINIMDTFCPACYWRVWCDTAGGITLQHLMYLLSPADWAWALQSQLGCPPVSTLVNQSPSAAILNRNYQKIIQKVSRYNWDEDIFLVETDQDWDCGQTVQWYVMWHHDWLHFSLISQHIEQQTSE